MGADTSPGPLLRGVTGVTAAYLGYLPPQIVELAFQRALLAESGAQGSLLGIEKSLQVLEPGLRGQQVPLLLGIAITRRAGLRGSASGVGQLCGLRGRQKGASLH